MTTMTAKLWPHRAGEMSRSTKSPAVPKTLVALMVLLGLALFAPALAQAEFSRPYIGQLTGFGGLGGLAVDPDPLKGDVFVGVGSGGEVVDELSPSNAFLEQRTGVPSHSLAFDDESGQLVGAGAREFVAVDNSLKLPEEYGDVYRASETEQASQRSVVRQIDDEGNPVDFKCKEGGKTPEYINGNELTGKPGETWYDEGREPPVRGIAVDSGSGPSAGDIYVINDSAREIEQLNVFSPEGCFVREITGAAVPEKNAFFSQYRSLDAVGVDPSNGDVLVESLDAAQETDAVYEFTEAGVFLGKLTGRSRAERFGERGLNPTSESSSLAVGSNGDLYVNVQEDLSGGPSKAVVDEFGRAGFYPSAVTGGVSGVGVGAVTLNGTIRGAENSLAKEDLKLSKCEFEYVTDAAYQKEGFDNPKTEECAPNLEGQRLKEEDYAVSAEIGGLEEGTVYRYRVVAETNPGEHGALKEGAVESFAAPAAPLVSDLSVMGVSSSFADFGATIDPRGEDTMYRFEYLSAEQYAANGESWSGSDAAVSVPVPAGDVGAGDAPVSVSVHAGGLLAGTSYRFRVVAQNAVGAVVGGAGAEGAFETSPASVPGLPDGRAYELVTPPNKEDSEDLFGGPPSVGGGQTRVKKVSVKRKTMILVIPLKMAIISCWRRRRRLGRSRRLVRVRMCSRGAGMVGLFARLRTRPWVCRA